MKVSVDLPTAVGTRLVKASDRTGISKNDLTRIFVASGLDQLEGDGVVLKGAKSAPQEPSVIINQPEARKEAV